MIPLFLGLTVANLVALLATIALGYAAVASPVAATSAATRGWHTLAGAMAAMLCTAVHCVVITYFIATAKWVRHALTVMRLDPARAAPTRSFKAQAFPAALASIAAVFAVAVLGAAVDNRLLAAAWHHAAALGAFAANAGAAVLEFHAINRNGRLIDGILADRARSSG